MENVKDKTLEIYIDMNKGKTSMESTSPVYQTPQRESVPKPGTLLLTIISLVCFSDIKEVHGNFPIRFSTNRSVDINITERCINAGNKFIYISPCIQNKKQMTKMQYEHFHGYNLIWYSIDEDSVSMSCRERHGTSICGQWSKRKYHCYWCPGDALRQIIRRHDVDYFTMLSLQYSTPTGCPYQICAASSWTTAPSAYRYQIKKLLFLHDRPCMWPCIKLELDIAFYVLTSQLSRHAIHPFVTPSVINCDVISRT